MDDDGPEIGIESENGIQGLVIDTRGRDQIHIETWDFDVSDHVL